MPRLGVHERTMREWYDHDRCDHHGVEAVPTRGVRTCYATAQKMMMTTERMSDKMYDASCIEISKTKYIAEDHDHKVVLAKPDWAHDSDLVPWKLAQTSFMWSGGFLVYMMDADIRFDQDLKPVNPYRRLNKKGRGILGKWGANLAADPLVTTFLDGVLHVLVIYRADQVGLVPALPGGMADLDADGNLETFTATLKRELVEEAVDEEGCASKIVVDALDSGDVVYSGYVEDPRNTSNAWIETCVVHAHIPTDVAHRLRLQGENDESKGASWMPASRCSTMYANHGEWVALVASKF